MGLEKYLFGASIALALVSCKTQELVKKPYIKAEQPKKVEVFENVEKPRLGYNSLRLRDGEFGIHKTTLYTPEPFNMGGPESAIRIDIIDKRKEYLKNNILSVTQNDLLKVSGYDFVDDFFYSNKVISVNQPKDKENLVDILKQTLFQGEVDYKDIGRALCKIIIESNRRTTGNTNGILIGSNYVLVPANVAYMSLAAEEAKKINKTDETIELRVSKTMDFKERNLASYYQARVLTINPLRGLALLEITDLRFEKNYAKPIFVTKVPELLEAELLSTEIKYLKNKFNTEDEDYRFIGPEEFSETELNFAKSFKYSIAAISGNAGMRGEVFFTSKGLAGLIDADLSGIGFSGYTMYDHLKVINGNLIRSFFEDYLLDLISENKDKASLFRFVGFDKKEQPVDTSVTLEDVLKSEDTREIPSITGVPEYIEPEEPKKDNSLIGFLLSFLGMSAVMGYFVAKAIKEPEEKEEWTKWSEIERLEKLNRLEEVLKPYYIKAEYEEAKTLNESRIIPATDINVGQDTIDDPNFAAYAAAHSKTSEDQATVIGIPGEDIPVSKMNITEADKSLFVNQFLMENIDNVEWISKETKERIARLLYGYKDEKKKN